MNDDPTSSTHDTNYLRKMTTHNRRLDEMAATTAMKTVDEEDPVNWDNLAEEDDDGDEQDSTDMAGLFTNAAREKKQESAELEKAPEPDTMQTDEPAPPPPQEPVPEPVPEPKPMHEDKAPQKPEPAPKPATPKPAPESAPETKPATPEPATPKRKAGVLEKTTTPAPVSESESPAPTRKRLRKRSASILLDTGAKDDDSQTGGDDSAGESEHVSIEAQGKTIADETDDESSAESAETESRQPSLAAFRQLDQAQEIEAENAKPNTLSAVFGKRFMSRLQQNIKICTTQNGRSKKFATDYADRVQDTNTGSFGLTAVLVAQRSLSTACQSEIDRITELEERNPQTKWGREAKCVMSETSKGVYRWAKLCYSKLARRNQDVNRALRPLLMGLLMAPFSYIAQDNRRVFRASIRFLPFNQDFLAYSLKQMVAAGLLPRREKAPDGSQIAYTHHTRLPALVAQDRSGDEPPHCHSALVQLVKTGPKPAAAGAVSPAKPTPAAPPIEDESEEPPSKARRRTVDDAAHKAAAAQAPKKPEPVAGQPLRSFSMHYSRATGAIVASHPEALCWSIQPALMSIGANELVLTPDANFLGLQQRLQEWQQDPAKLRAFMQAYSNKPRADLAMTRVLISANAKGDALQWVKLNREAWRDGSNSTLDAKYAAMGERAMFVAHALAGFLRADAILDMVARPARCETRRLEIDAADGDVESHALKLQKNTLLQQHDFHLTPLALRVYTDLFQRYLGKIKFDRDVVNPAAANDNFETSRERFEKENPEARLYATAGLASFPGTEQQRAEILQALLPIVHSIFPPRAI